MKTKWPEKPAGLTPLGEALGDTPIANYERARADAAMQRLRVAAAALESAYGYFAHYQGEVDGNFHAAHDALFEALQAIGELPKEQEG